MSPKNRPQDSSGVAAEQWSLVELETKDEHWVTHSWRLKYFKNGKGEVRPGLACDHCHAVRVLTVRQLQALDTRWRQEYR